MNEKILIFGDVVVPSGFGRIGTYVARYLANRGYIVAGACLQYDGLLPHPLLPAVWVAGLNGRDPWGAMTGIAGAFRPDVIFSLQDFPYHHGLRHGAGIDWSVTAHVMCTPIDGVPVYDEWLKVIDETDGALTISEFGVEAFRQAGRHVELCAPGVDTSEFFRLPDVQRVELRQRLNIPADAFMIGVMAMNQGRKDFPGMIKGFAEAFRDVPNAYLYLDCEKTSPAGWDLPRQVVANERLNPDRVRFREDAMRAGIASLNERYNLLDVHMVLSHREGFGLPHIEAMATQIPTVSLDYCSGPEIVGNNERGMLIKSRPGSFGTWGGAVDHDPDQDDLVMKLRALYAQPEERAVMGKRAYEYAITRTWDKAGAAVESVIRQALEKRAPDIARKYQVAQPARSEQPIIPAGIHQVFNVTGPIYIHADNPQELAAGIVGQPAVAVVEGNGNGS